MVHNMVDINNLPSGLLHFKLPFSYPYRMHKVKQIAISLLGRMIV